MMQPFELEKTLTTSLAQGLDAATAAERLATDGLNELYKPKPPSLAVLYLMQLMQVMMLLLFVSAIASLTIAAAGEDRDDGLSYIEGIAIMVIVNLNSIIAAVTESMANSALDALAKMSQAVCTVIRDGETITDLKTSHVVKGDIVFLEVGNIVPADCRIIDSADFKVRGLLSQECGFWEF